MADFGSAECKIITYLKNTTCLEEIDAVDIDESVLRGATYCCKPLTTDYLQPRSTPLTIKLWAGDVTQFDRRFFKVKAVTMVEV